MEYLYVCHFSNGHIKVGRSIDPKSRIAAHAERVSCVGIELIEHHIAPCVGYSAPAEEELIRKCAELATSRHKSEWFSGVDFFEACRIANIAASRVRGVFPMDFKTFYFSLPIPRRTEFAEEIGTTTGYCHQIAYGKRIELGIADVIVNASAGQIKLHELPLTDRAIFQSKARESITKEEA